METLAAKISEFEYKQRWVGKDKIRVICGPISKFKEYVDFDITDIGEHDNQIDNQP